MRIAAAMPSRTTSGALLTVGAMLSVQSGLAISLDLARHLSPEVVAWLRLSIAGVVLLLVTHPWTVRWSRSALGYSVLLGIVSGAMTVLFMLAASRLPLGTASALEFIGPLTVAVWRSRAGGRWWSVLAAGGVVLLARPWEGDFDALGLVFALSAAACWALYIVFSTRAGATVSGLRPLGISMPVAALGATAVVVPNAMPAIDPQLLLPLVVVALLASMLPFSFELLALRRLPTASFSTLMSLEPAIAATIGFVALGQGLSGFEVMGIALVVVACVMTNRANRPLVPSGHSVAVGAGAVPDGTLSARDRPLGRPS
jgi:inner membrane transporter RhtA